MKFTDGYWHLRSDVTAHYATEVHETKIESNALTIFAPSQAVKSRGDTLNQAVITQRFSSPMPNVIRVQMYRHKGGIKRTPTFELEPQAVNLVTIEETENCVCFQSGKLSAHINKTKGWHVEYLGDGELLTESGWRSTGVMETVEGVFAFAQLGLGVGECVYGLGERFTPFVKNGQVVDLWNEDGGTSSEQAYKNIPFYITNKGYGVFINQPEKVSLEIGSEKVERVQFSIPGETLDYCIIYGPSPKEILERYTALTGRPALPPAWSFGLWLTTSFTTDYDEATVTSFIQGMADRDIPLHVFHFDCFWMREFHWVDFKWDERVFPDPEGMLARLKERGLRICVWINPYIAQQSSMFEEGVEGGYLVKKPNGEVWQWDKWQAGMALVDFTNPAARKWYGDKLRTLLDMGVDCFKTDFGERIPTEVVYYDKSDPFKMHNYYAYLYNQTVFDVLEEKRGKGEAAVFARSATTGSQKFPVHWGGDNTATYESMAETLRGGLSLCLSGFGFWSHDIGGFEQTASADLYKRWCAFGLLSSHSRLHGSQSYRVPWLFDEEAVDVLRHFTKLKCQLMPYLFQAATVAHQTGVPTMRAMFLEFPDDPTTHYLDRQYMLGDSLLIAPVFDPTGKVSYYLPEGRWTNFTTGEIVQGGRWQRETHDYMNLPLMVRPNSIIAVGANAEKPDYDYADGITFHVFELGDGETRQVEIPNLQGETVFTLTATKEGNLIYIQSIGNSQGWQILLRDLQPKLPREVEGGNYQQEKLGLRIIPNVGVSKLVVLY